MLYPGKKKKKRKKKERKILLLTVRPLGATLRTCTRGGRVGQGSVVTAFLGEVDLSFSNFFFGNSPKMGATEGVSKANPYG